MPAPKRGHKAVGAGKTPPAWCLWAAAVVLVSRLAAPQGVAAGGDRPVSVAVRWPWGPSVKVGPRTFRIDVLPQAGRPLVLTLWDLREPGAAGGPGGEEIFGAAAEELRRRFPFVSVERQVLSRQDMQRRWEQAARGGGHWPDVMATYPGTYRFPGEQQLPLEGYLAHALAPAARAQALPGALAMASWDGHLWGLPRWVEWAGWAVRPQGGGGRVAVELSNPLTWRMLAAAAGEAAESLWSRRRLKRAAQWLDSMRSRLVPPARVCQLGPTELLLRGEASAAGPLTGRLALRLGAWPAPSETRQLAMAAGRLALAGRVAVEGVAAQLPGPLVQASSYVLFAGPAADEGRLRAAWELAVALARAASRTLPPHEGIVPAWNPRPALESQQAAPGGAAGEEPWWRHYPLPPGMAELVQAAAGGPAPGQRGEQVLLPGAAAQGVFLPAVEWEDFLHEQTVVARLAAEFCRGRMSLEQFVEQAGR